MRSRDGCPAAWGRKRLCSSYGHLDQQVDDLRTHITTYAETDDAVPVLFCWARCLPKQHPSPWAPFPYLPLPTAWAGRILVTVLGPAVGPDGPESSNVLMLPQSLGIPSHLQSGQVAALRGPPATGCSEASQCA